MLSLFSRVIRSMATATSAPTTTTCSVRFLPQSDAVAIDQELFNEYGFSVDQLMELAGLACAQAVHELYPKGRVLVLAGPGNNGGDGLVCARHLKLFGFLPEIYYPKQSKTELMQRLVKQTTLMQIPYHDALPSDLSSYALAVDALFGFSFRPPLRPPFDQVLTALLDCKDQLPVFSIDIPLGWQVEEGPPADTPAATFQPDTLISLTAPKLCARRFQGRAHFLGGRFVPQSLADKYDLNLPSFPGSAGIVRIDR